MGIFRGGKEIFDSLVEEVNNLYDSLGPDYKSWSKSIDDTTGSNQELKKKHDELLLKLDECLEKIKDLEQYQNIIESNVEKLIAANIALAAKLDAEDVTNLDTNYEQTIKTKLYN